MSRHARNTGRRAPGRSGGFTLVELLVVMTIIAILATMTLGVLHMAGEAGRQVKTKSTIARLHGILVDRVESYRTRRVPVDTLGLTPQQAAHLRLAALRQIIRMEMPERWVDLVPLPDPTVSTLPNPAIAVVDPSTGNAWTVMEAPALALAYRRRYEQAKLRVESVYPIGGDRDQSQDRLNRYSSAECLYMIATMGREPDVRAQFSESEIGDADADGLPEFHDAWGNPILFLRWAPGFTESDIQAETFGPDPTAPLNYVPYPPGGPDPPARFQEAALQDHDPYDHRNLFSYAYRLVPLIYSAGPDGVYDINFEKDYRAGYVNPTSGSSLRGLGDPFYFLNGGSRQVNRAGIPVDSWNESVTAMDPPSDPGDPMHGPKRTADSLDHFDNIHNHRIEAD